MRHSHSFKWGRFNFSFSLKMWWASKTRTMGIYDWVSGGYKVLFLDYDNIRKEWLMQELKRIQRENKLSTIYIFQTRKKNEEGDGSFHAICCDVLSNIEAQRIILTTNCDETFKKAMYYDYCSHVLRTFPKGGVTSPQHLLSLKSEHNQRKKSLAHLRFLQFQYDIPSEEMNYENHNNNGKLWLIDYPTRKNILPDPEKIQTGRNAKMFWKGKNADIRHLRELPRKPSML